MRSVGLALLLFEQKTAYEMRISDLSSDVCSSDRGLRLFAQAVQLGRIQDQAFVAALAADAARQQAQHSGDQETQRRQQADHRQRERRRLVRDGARGQSQPQVETVHEPTIGSATCWRRWGQAVEITVRAGRVKK